MRILLLLFCLFLASPACATETFEGRVVGVNDGDTITVLAGKAQQIKVRLYGVDCPESKQAYGNQAKAFTATAVFGKVVRVEVSGRDRYGRTLGIVYGPEGSALNRDLLINGLAWVYERYCVRPECAQWRNDESTARSAQRGLWSDVKLVPPWEFRKSSRRPPMPDAMPHLKK